MTTDGRVGGRLPSLTGLRFVAAFVVFGFHLSVTGIVGGNAGVVFQWIFAPGAVGVSFFFILSGFVLTWSARQGDTARRFWRRRFAKIYPNHLATWIPTLVIMLITGTALTPLVAVANVALIQSWFPNERVYYGMNTVSWSLACEMFFYLLFPLLHRGVARLSHRAVSAATVGALSLVWVIPIAAQLMPEDLRYWAIWVFPLARLPEFVSGMLLARTVADGHWPMKRIWPVTTLTVIAYLTSRWIPDDVRIVAFAVVPMALLVAAVGAADAEGRPSLWRSKTAVWLGEISYAFYLVHQLIMRAVVKVFGIPDQVLLGMVIAVGTLALTVLVAWLLFRYVETPGMRLLKEPRSEFRRSQHVYQETSR